MLPLTFESVGSLAAGAHSLFALFVTAGTQTVSSRHSQSSSFSFSLWSTLRVSPSAQLPSVGHWKSGTRAGRYWRRSRPHRNLRECGTRLRRLLSFRITQSEQLIETGEHALSQPPTVEVCGSIYLHLTSESRKAVSRVIRCSTASSARGLVSQYYLFRLTF